MNDKLAAIQKKIQSTKSELKCISQELNTSSPEYQFTSEVLNKRLSDLSQRETRFLHSPPNSVPKREEPLLLNIDTISISQNNPAELISLKTLSHFLFGFHHLLDYFIKECEYGPLRVTDRDLRIRLTENSPLTLELMTKHPSNVITYQNTLSTITELLKLQSPGSAMPSFLIEWDPRIFTYAKKWVTFLWENELIISSYQNKLLAESENLKNSLDTLNAIQKETSDPVLISGILGAINLSDRQLELIDPVSRKKTKANGSLSLLLESRHLLGETVQVEINNLITQNLQTGEKQGILLLNRINS